MVSPSAPLSASGSAGDGDAALAAGPGSAGGAAGGSAAARQRRRSAASVYLFGADNRLTYREKEKQEQPAMRRTSLISSGGTSTLSERDAKLAATLITSKVESTDDEVDYWYIIHPIKSRFRRDWDLLLCVLIVYNALAVPYRIAFSTVEADWVRALDYAVDALFMVDIPLNFITGYVYKGETVLKPSRIARAYATTFLIPDVLSIIPFELLQSTECDTSTRADGTLSECSLGELNSMLKILKLFRLARILRVLRLARIVKRFIRTLQIKHSVLAIARFCLLIIVAAHWISCAWVLTAQFNDYGEGSWMGQVGPWTERSRPSWYLMSLYSTVMIMATIGSNIQPVNDEERGVYMISMLIGASCFAYGITNMCSLLFNLNRREVAYHESVDELNEFITFRNLPRHVAYRLREYFEFLHSRNRFFDEGTILDKLSPSLRQQCVLHINETIIRSNAFFAKLDDAFISTVIMNLQKLAFMPDEVIVKQGDVGHEMFFVSEGNVEILVEGAAHPVGKLGPGDYFGEIALFRDDSVRTATIRSVSFCDIFSLTRATIEEVLNLHPGSKERWYAIAAQRLERLESAVRNVDTMNVPKDEDGSEASSHASSGRAGSGANRRTSIIGGMVDMAADMVNKIRRRSSVMPGVVTTHGSQGTDRESRSSIADMKDAEDAEAAIGAAVLPLPKAAAFFKEQSAAEDNSDTDSGRVALAYRNRVRRNSLMEEQLRARLAKAGGDAASSESNSSFRKLRRFSEINAEAGPVGAAMRSVARRRSSVLRHATGNAPVADYHTMLAAREEETNRWNDWLQGVPAAEEATSMLHELRDEVLGVLLRVEGILSRTGVGAANGAGEVANRGVE